MKTSELRDKSVEDLQKEHLSVLKELFNLRMQKSSGQPPQGKLFRTAKLTIARIKTLLLQKGVRI